MLNADMNHARPDLSPSALFGDLPILRLRMEYEVDDPELLPEYLGSSWRGVLGWQMQRLCCPFGPRRACSDCLIREQCPYFVLYEQQSDLPGFRNTPRPYILLPEAGESKDRQFLTITLIGTAVRTAPLIWKTIQEATEKGLGREQVRFRVHGWLEDCPDQGWKKLPQTESYRHIQGTWKLSDYLSPALDAPWTVELAPPLRLRAQGRYLTGLDWPCFLSSLAQRLETLSVIFHTKEQLGKQSWTEIQKSFSALIPHATHALNWQDWSRYSNRQRKKIPMGGLCGKIIIKRASTDLWPWLQSAGLMHVGKGAAMGMGGMNLRALR